MESSKQLLLGSVIKIAITLLTVGVLILFSPSYVTAYITINYEILLIYIVCALTFLYCLVSSIMYFFVRRRAEDAPLTNYALSEVILCSAGIMGWLIVVGLGATISQRTSSETGERFGWLAALAGINVGCFLVNLGMICFTVINDKILVKRRQRKYIPGNAY